MCNEILNRTEYYKYRQALETAYENAETAIKMLREIQSEISDDLDNAHLDDHGVIINDSGENIERESVWTFALRLKLFCDDISELSSNYGIRIYKEN